MQRARRQIGRLTCDIVGPDVPTGRLPVVLIHGLGGGTWYWENFQSRFAEHRRSSYALELPGHDGKPDPRLGDYSVESFALHVAAALAEIGDCFVIGHSMGGLIAQKLAETQPRAGYVFLCSAPPWHFFRRAYWPFWKWLLRHPVRHIAHAVNRDPILLTEELDTNLVNNRLPADLQHEVFKRSVPDSGHAGLQLVLGLVKVDERRIASPCVVVGGLADRMMPHCEQVKLANYYKCQIKMFDRGHMLMLEASWEEICDDLAGWMETHEALQTTKLVESRATGG